MCVKSQSDAVPLLLHENSVEISMKQYCSRVERKMLCSCQSGNNLVKYVIVGKVYAKPQYQLEIHIENRGLLV